ncbi:MAG: hypothetical protein ACI3ZQ_10510 [Candidatus Cryptobacteroides sp.]
MRNSIFILVFASIVLSACTDKSFAGPDSTQDIGASAVIPVRVAVGNALVKGVGDVDGIDDLYGKDFYVYAFRKSRKVRYDVTAATDRAYCLLDASTDGETGQWTGGKKARFAVGPYASWPGKSVNWSNGENHKDAYDFFAYFIDDAELTKIVRSDDKIDIEFTIDGSQDIMTSKAHVQNTGFSGQDAQYVSAWSFSQFTAFRNIVPTFTFNHGLTRLCIATGTDGAAEIEELSVLSKKKAVLTLVHKDETQTGISFTDGNVLTMNNDAAYKYALKTFADAQDGRHHVLAAPADKYRIFVTVNENGASKVLSAEFTNSGKGFEAGRSYNAGVTVKRDGSGNLYLEMK